MKFRVSFRPDFKLSPDSSTRCIFLSIERYVIGPCQHRNRIAWKNIC